MAVECVGDVGVEAPPALCFASVADLERWTEWARDLERVEVLDRGGDGRPSRVRMVADLFGKEFDAVVDFHHDKAPDELRFSLVEARKLASLEGSFRFEPESGGTQMSYRLQMVLVKPKAARIERMVSRKIDTALSRDLRRHIERNVARR
ncbi:MAG: SRPBCC family protein [Actinobacteria bacterium]|nr:SRPBCC family protein [Actinomycetota bacterium]